MVDTPTGLAIAVFLTRVEETSLPRFTAGLQRRIVLGDVKNQLKTNIIDWHRGIRGALVRPGPSDVRHRINSYFRHILPSIDYRI